MNLKYLHHQSKSELLLPQKRLKEVYETVCHKKECQLIKTEDGHYEHEKTIFEDKVVALLKKHHKLQVLRSVWIGNRNIDLFIPALKSELKRGKRFHGLAIEVDGGIHDREFKMKRDDEVFSVLLNLGIAILTVKNEDCNTSYFTNLIKNLRISKRLDTRSRRRLWRNIYIYTILKQVPTENLRHYFSEESVVLLEKVKNHYL